MTTVDEIRPHVLVTGASRGIGAGIARHLGRSGFHISVGYRSGAQPAARVVADVRTSGGDAIALQADITDMGEVEEMVRRAVDRFGPIDGLICNAGALFGGRGLGGVDRRTWAEVVDVNVAGAYRCIVAAEAHLTLGALIVTTSSPAAFYGSPLGAHYSAGKAGVVALTRAVAGRLESLGARINCVVPGSFPSELRSTMPPEVRDQVASESALRRRAEPEEMGSVVEFLLSPAGHGVSGQLLFVDGGRFMFP